MDDKKIEGKFGEMKGDLKQTAGDALGDKDMKREGQKDKAEGRMDQIKGDVKDTIRDIKR